MNLEDILLTLGLYSVIVSLLEAALLVAMVYAPGNRILQVTAAEALLTFIVLYPIAVAIDRWLRRRR